MTKAERMAAALAGGAVDRTPVSFWRHFPEADGGAGTLADAVVAFHKRYDLDFVKITPRNTFCVEDWGCWTEYRPNREGVRTVVRRAVEAIADWRALRVLDPHAGALGEAVRCVELAKKGMPDDAPVLQTVFSPAAVARKVAGDALLTQLKTDPVDVHMGLAVIAETMRAFARACMEAGADGIFFATQLASESMVSAGSYREFGRPYDLQVLDGARGGWCSILHIHGADIFFDLLKDYPVHAVNWQARRTAPTLGEAAERYAGALVGGLDEVETIPNGPVAAIRAEAVEAARELRGRRLVLAPGCVIPIDTPEAHLDAVRAAVEQAGHG